MMSMGMEAQREAMQRDGVDEPKKCEAPLRSEAHHHPTAIICGSKQLRGLTVEEPPGASRPYGHKMRDDVLGRRRWDSQG